MKNSGYPVWSIYRMLYDYTDPTSLAANLANLARTSATTLYGDFVPASSLSVFHSHFPQVVTSFGDGYTANNGIVAGTHETGGDMGGAVLTAQSNRTSSSTQEAVSKRASSSRCSPSLRASGSSEGRR